MVGDSGFSRYKYGTRSFNLLKRLRPIRSVSRNATTAQAALGRIIRPAMCHPLIGSQSLRVGVERHSLSRVPLHESGVGPPTDVLGAEASLESQLAGEQTCDPGQIDKQGNLFRHVLVRVTGLNIRACSELRVLTAITASDRSALAARKAKRPGKRSQRFRGQLERTWLLALLQDWETKLARR